MDANEVGEALKAASHREGDVEISFLDAEVEGPKATVRVRLLVFGGGHVRDIKEQEIPAAAPLFHDPERTAAFAEGLELALGEALKGPTEQFEPAMPSDFVFFEVLELKKPQTPEEFRDALLTKKRLGRFTH